MTLNELRYIVAVAKERHFGRAAAACFVSQPTLSVAVKKLEDELGITLFERQQSDVLVTELGKTIIQQAQAVLELTQDIKKLAAHAENPLEGTLKLGIIYTIGPYLMPSLISDIQTAAPNLELIIDEDFTHNLIKKLNTGDIDMAIIALPFEFKGLETRMLYQEPFVVALPKGHDLARKKRLAPKDISDETMLLLKSGNCFRDQVLQFCPHCIQSAESQKLQKTLEASSIETIRQMVAIGAGITLLPATAVDIDNRMQDLLEYRPFVKPHPYRDVALMHRSQYPITALLDFIETTVKQSNIQNITVY